MRAQAVGKQDMIEAEWNRSYTGKYLPGDTIHEIRNGPLKSSITNGAAARVLLARNVKRSANMLDRSQRLQRSEEQLAMKLKAKCTYKTAKGYSSERNGVRGGAASTRAALLSSAAAESDGSEGESSRERAARTAVCISAFRAATLAASCNSRSCFTSDSNLQLSSFTPRGRARPLTSSL